MEIVKTEIVYPNMGGGPEHRVIEVHGDFGEERGDGHVVKVTVQALAVIFTVRTVNEFTGDEIVQFVKDKIASMEM